MNALTRTDNDTWTYQVDNTESLVTLKTPYKCVAELAQRCLKEAGNPLSLKKSITFSCDKYKWRMEQSSFSKSWYERLLPCLPLTQKVSGPPHLLVKVTQEKKRLKKVNYAFSGSIKNPYSEIAPIPFNLSSKRERLNHKNLDDPFTKISTQAFESVEKQWIPTFENNSSSQIILRDGKLHLEPKPKQHSTLKQREANRVTMEAFRRFVYEEYGISRIEYIEYAYHFSLQEMIRKGQPLTPEIVYRINLGVHNVEIQYLQEFLKRLYLLKVHLSHASIPSNTCMKDYLLQYNQNASFGSAFSLKELRGLIELIECCEDDSSLATHNLVSILCDTIDFPKSLKVHDFSPENLDRVMSIFYPSDCDWDKIYTGRKIAFKSIMGFYTLADSDTFKPWVDLQEILQIFPLLSQKQDLDAYYELLSHVACKKHLVRRHPSDKWRVGALIPAPRDENGVRHWYAVTSCLDDRLADFHYTLEPLSTASELPFIKLYRSTASSKYAQSNMVSLFADLQPFHVPGGQRRWAAQNYENPIMFQRTIPLWVGYFEHGQSIASEVTESMSIQEQAGKWKSATSTFYRAVIELINGKINELSGPYEWPEDSLISEDEMRLRRSQELASWRAALDTFSGNTVHRTKIKQKSEMQLKHFIETAQKQSEAYISLLTIWGHAEQELSQYKIAQDVAFIGHSLGGSLAQGGMYLFSSSARRIPLKNRRFYCFSSDAPGISWGENEAIMNYGRAHEVMLSHRNKTWEVSHLFEKGDPVPQAGSRHLGVKPESDQHDDSEWLNFSAKVFHPLDPAKNIEVYDAPTHGRRIGRAKEAVDFTPYSLSPYSLQDFNSSWFLDKNQQHIWGYKIILSPKLSEGIRRIVGVGSLPFQKISSLIDRISPPRGSDQWDSNEYFFVLVSRKTLKTLIIKDRKIKEHTIHKIDKACHNCF